jgi:hypothetical protein
VDSISLAVLSRSGPGSARSGKYPSEGGNQPGDAWDLYVGYDKRIQAIMPTNPFTDISRFLTATTNDYMHQATGVTLSWHCS